MSEKSARQYVKGIIHLLEDIPYDRIKRVVNLLFDVNSKGNKIIVFGNGGSAATASHLICDLGKIITNASRNRFRALSLTDNVSVITAAGNDLGYDEIFVEQLRSLLKPGDVVITISASGNSENILRALQYAEKCGVKRIGLMGFDGGQMRGWVDESIWIKNDNYKQVEDIHLIIGHLITLLLKEKLDQGRK